MPSDPAATRRRALKLFSTRTTELVDPNAPLSRRARTLSIPSAAKEALQLGKLAFRSKSEGWQARRGEKMRRDVANEALEILHNDQPLKARPALRDALEKHLSMLTAEEISYSWENLNQLTALAESTSTQYFELAHEQAKQHITKDRPSLLDFESTIEQTVSHARGVGWSDEAISTIAGKLSEHDDIERALTYFFDQLATSPKIYKSEISIGSAPDPHWIETGYGLEPILGSKDELLAIRLETRAQDPWAAGRAAYERCTSVLGAANVFLRTPYELGDEVVVYSDGTKQKVLAKESMRRDVHNPKREQIRKTLELAAKATLRPLVDDTLHSAIRNQHRAISTADVESSFILLWAGLERLGQNPKQPGPTLATTSTLVSSALSLSKIRREISALSEAIAAHLTSQGHSKGRELLHRISDEIVRENPVVVKHDALVDALLGSNAKSREFCSHFYEESPHLAQWYFRLRRSLISSDEDSYKRSPRSLQDSIPRIIEQSRQHIEWQIKRLYRARNGIAHGFERPRWLLDLTQHANHYLTNVISICVTYSSEEGTSTFDILKHREGWLNAYLELARNGDVAALSNNGLLRPSSLFR